MADLLKQFTKISAFSAYNNRMREASQAVIDKGFQRKRKRDAIDTVVLMDEDEQDGDLDVGEDRQVTRESRKKKKAGKLSNSAKSPPREKPSKKRRSKRRRLEVGLDNGGINEAGSGQERCNGGFNESEVQGGISRILNLLTSDDSSYNARLAFAWLIDPISVTAFFEDYWEKKPLHIRRSEHGYYDGLFSSVELEKILHEHDIQYTVNLDITRYANGQRITLNPPGRAYAATVRKYLKGGCSVRLLNPQTYSDTVWRLNSTLQELFGTFVGANVYLTPRNTQGFAPHYDDIEAFVLQLEGIKRWRVYKPRNEDETLPRFSSPNFKRDEIGKPILEVELRPGDLLYFPRGFIHEAVASDEDSLHITVSTTQRNTWGDLLQILLDQALQTAITENVEYRRSLPLNYLDTAGTVHMDKKKKGRKAFIEKAKQLINGLVDYALIDGAADQMAKNYMQDSLPPCLSEKERDQSVLSDSQKSPVKFTENTKIRLVRRHCLRLVMEDESAVSIYYNTENSRTYHEKDLQHFKVESEAAPGIDFLVESYPNWVNVGDLPLDSQNERVQLCEQLYCKALLIVS